MKLTIAIAALCAPSISASASGVATSILKQENNQGPVRLSAPKNKECFFAGGFKVNIQKSLQVGIPLCEIGELCEEDSTSSLGGRCVTVSSNLVAPKPQRDLCEKCSSTTSIPACHFGTLDRAVIACGSCIGDGACNNLPLGVTIGAGSCLKMTNFPATVLESVGEQSCNGKGACYSLNATVGDNSCNGKFACADMEGDDLPNNMCNGDYQCRMLDYQAPVTSSPGWNITYDSMKVNLTADTTEELIFSYNISSGRAYEY
eukprot:scaffold37376_cov23-Cyclotella_meneghiniana.AAC.1